MYAYDGFLSQDLFTLGGVQAKDHVFEEWTLALCLYALCSYVEGLLGLGYSREPPEGAEDRMTGVLQRFAEQRTLDENIVSFRLPGRNGEAGELRFGDTNADLYDPANLVRLPHAPPPAGRLGDMAQGTWTVGIEGMRLDVPGGPLESAFPAGAIAVLATTMPYIMLPEELEIQVSRALGAEEGGHGFYKLVDCEKRAQMPSMQFLLGGQGEGEAAHQFDLTAFDYTLEVDGYCFLALKAASYFGVGPGPVNATVLGNSFLRKFYSVLNFEDKSVSCECARTMEAVV